MAPRTSDVADDAQVGVVRGPVDADAQGAGDGVLERHAPELLHQQRHHFRRKPRADEEAGQARRGEEKRQVAELLLEATLRSTLGCFFAITESSPLSLEARGGNVVRQVRVGCKESTLKTQNLGLLQKSQRRRPQPRVRHVQVPRKHVQRSVPVIFITRRYPTAADMRNMSCPEASVTESPTCVTRTVSPRIEKNVTSPVCFW